MDALRPLQRVLILVLVEDGLRQVILLLSVVQYDTIKFYLL